jgi:hypothetical protein
MMPNPVDAAVSNMSGVDTTVYESYDGGDPTSGQQQTRGVPWHRRLSPETWLMIVILGALAGLWIIAGSFRKVLS